MTRNSMFVIRCGSTSLVFGPHPKPLLRPLLCLCRKLGCIGHPTLLRTERSISLQGCDSPGQVHVQDSAIFAEVLMQLFLREHIANVHVWSPRAHTNVN